MTQQAIKWQFLPVILVIILGLVGCGAQATAPAATGSEVDALNLPVNLNPSTLDEIRDRDDVFVLDVREDFEYAEGHIPGVTLIPLKQIPARLDEIPTDKTVVAVCRSGNRSGQATKFLRGQGFGNVHNMQGGMNAWTRAGYEIEK